jgi:uncharacterized protein (DUF1499 family)
MAAASFPTLGPPAWPVKLTRGSLWLVGFALLLVAVSGPLNKFGVVGFQLALLLFAGGALLLVVGALLVLVGVLVGAKRGSPVPKGAAVLGLVVALGVFGYLFTWVSKGRGVPPIHEVSTDLQDPPAFVAVVPVRKSFGAVNPPEYVAKMKGPGGEIDVPAAQRKAYPDLQPLTLDLPPAETYARAKRAVEQLGWTIVADVPAEGRLEATDTTAFFGFKDDVVVRVRAEQAGSRLDVRSKSRVGLGDVGTNAARVRKFLEIVRRG